MGGPCRTHQWKYQYWCLDHRVGSVSFLDTPQLIWSHSWTLPSVASVPGLHAQLLSLAVRKAGSRPGQIYHVMRAAADVTFSLLTSGFVFSPSLSLTWIQFVLSVQFVLWVRLLLDRSWLYSYCTWRQQWHASHDKSVQAFSLFFVLQAPKAGHRGLGIRLPTNILKGCDNYEELVGSKAIPNKPFNTVDDQRLQIQFRCGPTRATENPISTPDFSQQPMLTRKKSRWWRPRSMDKTIKAQLVWSRIQSTQLT